MIQVQEAEIEVHLVTTPAGKMVRVKAKIGQAGMTFYLNRVDSDAVANALLYPEPDYRLDEPPIQV